MLFPAMLLLAGVVLAVIHWQFVRLPDLPGYLWIAWKIWQNQRQLDALYREKERRLTARAAARMKSFRGEYKTCLTEAQARAALQRQLIENVYTCTGCASTFRHPNTNGEECPAVEGICGHLHAAGWREVPWEEGQPIWQWHCGTCAKG
jgi:hypothetical protein